MKVQYVARDASGAVKARLLDDPKTRGAAAVEMAAWRRQKWTVSKETVAETNRTPLKETSA